jgi:competence protein ComEC
MPGSKFSRVWYVVVLLLLANLAIWFGVWQMRPLGFARLYFFNVGQGDAIYLRTIHGSDILIDGGPDKTVVEKLGQAMPLLDRSIELLVLTHASADYVTGLVDILNRYEVKQVLLSDVGSSASVYYEFRRLLAKKHIPIITPRLGQRIYLDDSTTFDVYAPLFANFADPAADVNSVSVVGRVSFGHQHVLFASNMDKDGETQLLQWQVPVDAQILKVAQHGSSHASGEDFVAAVHPDYSVISVGKNSASEPAPETLDVLGRHPAHVLRTDQDGDVAFALFPERVELLPRSGGLQGPR